MNRLTAVLLLALLTLPLQAGGIDPVTNFGKANLSTGIDGNATTVTVALGQGARFPNPTTLGPYNVVIWCASLYGDPSDDPAKEIVRVTARSGDAFTVTRAQEGTYNWAHNTPAKIYRMILPVTAQTWTEIDQQLTALPDTDAAHRVRLDTLSKGFAFRRVGQNIFPVGPTDLVSLHRLSIDPGTEDAASAFIVNGGWNYPAASFGGNAATHTVVIENASRGAKGLLLSSQLDGAPLLEATYGVGTDSVLALYQNALYIYKSLHLKGTAVITFSDGSVQSTAANSKFGGKYPVDTSQSVGSLGQAYLPMWDAEGLKFIPTSSEIWATYLPKSHGDSIAGHYVDLTGLADGKVIKYDNASGHWIIGVDATGGGAGGGGKLDSLRAYDGITVNYMSDSVVAVSVKLRTNGGLLEDANGVAIDVQSGGGLGLIGNTIRVDSTTAWITTKAWAMNQLDGKLDIETGYPYGGIYIADADLGTMTRRQITGDVSLSTLGVTSIGANKVTSGMLQQVGTGTWFGRTSAGTGNVEQVSTANLKTALSLNLVENTALSTWAGSTNITTLGTVASGTWSASTIAVAKGGTGATTAAGALVNLLPSMTGNGGKYLMTDGTGTLWQTPAGGGGSGTVTSIGVAMPSQFGVTGSPVTSAGTITVDWNSQGAGMFLSRAGGGTSGAPTFRLPVLGDFPFIADSLGKKIDSAWVKAFHEKSSIGSSIAAGHGAVAVSADSLKSGMYDVDATADTSASRWYARQQNRRAYTAGHSVKAISADSLGNAMYDVDATTDTVASRFYARQQNRRSYTAGHLAKSAGDSLRNGMMDIAATTDTAASRAWTRAQIPASSDSSRAAYKSDTTIAAYRALKSDTTRAAYTAANLTGKTLLPMADTTYNSRAGKVYFQNGQMHTAPDSLGAGLGAGNTFNDSIHVTGTLNAYYNSTFSFPALRMRRTEGTQSGWQASLLQSSTDLQFTDLTGTNIIGFTSAGKIYTGATSDTVLTKSTGRLKSKVIGYFSAGSDSTLINTNYKFPMGYSTGCVIDTIIYIMNGGSIPSVTPSIKFGLDISAAGTSVITSPSAVTSNTAVTKISTFNNGTIASGLTMWLTFTATPVKPRTFMAYILGHDQ